jgi:hypothetical protein
MAGLTGGRDTVGKEIVILLYRRRQGLRLAHLGSGFLIVIFSFKTALVFFLFFPLNSARSLSGNFLSPESKTFQPEREGKQKTELKGKITSF